MRRYMFTRGYTSLPWAFSAVVLNDSALVAVLAEAPEQRPYQWALCRKHNVRGKRHQIERDGGRCPRA